MKLSKEKRVELFNEFGVVISYFDLKNDLMCCNDIEKLIKFHKNAKVNSHEIASDMMQWLVENASILPKLHCFDFMKSIISKVEWYLSDQNYEKQSIEVLGKKITQSELKNAIRLLDFGFRPSFSNIEEFLSFIQGDAFDYILDLENKKVDSENYISVVRKFLNSIVRTTIFERAVYEKRKSGELSRIKPYATKCIQELTVSDINMRFWLACIESEFSLIDLLSRFPYLINDLGDEEKVKELLKNVFSNCSFPYSKSLVNKVIQMFTNDKNLPLYLSIIGADDETIVNCIHPKNYDAVEFKSLMVKIKELGYRELRYKLIHLTQKSELFKFITLMYYMYDDSGEITINTFKDMIDGMPDDFWITEPYALHMAGSLARMLESFNYDQDICSRLADKVDIWLSSDNKKMRMLGAYVLDACQNYLIL